MRYTTLSTLTFPGQQGIKYFCDAAQAGLYIEANELRGRCVTGFCRAMEHEGKYYVLGHVVTVERLQPELLAIIHTVNNGLANAVRANRQPPQPTLFQFWRQPAPPAATQTAPQSDDPMDVDTNEQVQGYDYWGVTGS